MAVGFARVIVKDVETKVIELEGYDPTIYDATCNEISNYSIELDLGCLRYLDGASICIFNYYQCYDILNREIPLLRTKNLSKYAQEALDGLVFAIKDTDNPYAFLYLEGD